MPTNEGGDPDPAWREAVAKLGREYYEGLLQGRREECRSLMEPACFEYLVALIAELRPGRMERAAPEGRYLREGARARDHSVVYMAIAEGTKARLGNRQLAAKWFADRDKAVAGIWEAIDTLRLQLEKQFTSSEVATMLGPLQSEYRRLFNPPPQEAPDYSGPIDWSANRAYKLLTHSRVDLGWVKPEGGRPPAVWRSQTLALLTGDAGLIVEDAEGLLEAAELTEATPRPDAPKRPKRSKTRKSRGM